eukprot:GHVH01008147.1.p1 GENE.GHVH01008147.1~~GHVH01008147.1.p1  ORF type:complete len:311 (+),score=46.52 GHVH01008147.1:54-986(+)
MARTTQVARDRHDICALMQKMAREAGALILKNLQDRNKDIKTKQSDSDLVTDTDVACEDIIKDTILENFPHHEILAEESVAPGSDCINDGPTWVIDPIDGTMNFAKTNPYTCVSIGFMMNRKSVVGVVYAPFYDEMFHAVKDEGAYLNGIPIHVAEPLPLTRSVVNTGFLASLFKIRNLPSVPSEIMNRINDLEDVVVHNFKTILLHSCDIRRTGASALELCWVANGRLDSSYEIGNKEWDLSAGTLILEEAGGYCCLLDGTKMDIGARQYLATSNEDLAKEIVSLIRPPSCCIRQLDSDIEAFKQTLKK